MLRLELNGITKQYPLVRAVDGVQLQVAPGDIHAVLGENGAGKSSLMKVIYGAVQADAGEMRVSTLRSCGWPAPPRRGLWASAWCTSTSRSSTR